MLWRAFRLADREFDLSHLNDLSFEFVIDAKEGKPEQRYQVDAIFGLHCFTKAGDTSASYSSDLEYADARETRLFDHGRYDLSRRLPAIVTGIGLRKCFHGRDGNFYVIEKIRLADAEVAYFVFFKLSRGLGERLNLFVSSAYVPDAEFQPTPRERKPIRFGVIAYNVKSGRSIKRPS